ncbi:MAG: GMC family oxidoreductase [Luteolibacter sp.]
MSKQYDYVIVGAGVAGALLAWKIKSEKPEKSVLLVDAGDNELDASMREQFVNAFALNVDRSILAPYRGLESNRAVPSPESGGDRKYFVQAGPDIHKSNYLRIVGGSTWAWRGNCPRWVPADFEMESLYHCGKDWPFKYKDIESWFCDAEIELGVSGNHVEQDGLQGAFRSRSYPMGPIAQALGDIVIKKRVDGETVYGKRLTVLATPQARNSREYQGRAACLGNANCIPICPTGAKYDASVHIKKAQSVGVETQWHAVVSRIDLKENGTVNGVYYLDWRQPGTSEQHIEGKMFILAAHAIETPRLWLNSGLDNSRDLVGRFLMDHLSAEVTGYLNQPIYPFRGPQNTSSIFDFRDGEFRSRHAAFNVTVGNDGWGRKLHPFAALEKCVWNEKTGRISKLGKALQYELGGDDVAKAVTRLVRIGYSTEQLPDPNNVVTLADEKDPLGIPRPKISYRLDDYSINGLAQGRLVCAEILEKAGADVDHTPEPSPSYNGAGHPMGTMRMGSSIFDSVVNPYGRSHAHANLYVIGSSTLVTGSTVNPTLLLAALALRTASYLVSHS